MADRRSRQSSGGFAPRLRQVIDAYGSANSIAKSIERSEGAVRKWLRGESEPNVTDLRALCEHTHTSIEWLVTGRGRREPVPMALQEAAPPAYGEASSTQTEASSTQTIDHALLERIIEALDEQISQQPVPLSAAKRSMLVVTLYDLFHDSREVDREALVRLVRLAR